MLTHGLSNRLTSGDVGGRFLKLDLTRMDSQFFVWTALSEDLTDT